MATAEQKKTIPKQRLQELRNQCRDHYNVVEAQGFRQVLPG